MGRKGLGEERQTERGWAGEGRGGSGGVGQRGFGWTLMVAASRVPSGGFMRKIVGFVLGLMLLSALGNFIGGSDMPVTAAVGVPAGVPAAHSVAPVVPSFEASLYVTANSLNLRDSPSTSGRVLGTLARNRMVQAGAQQDGWVNVRFGDQTAIRP